MRSSYVWALVLLAGVGILHAVSPGRPLAVGEDPRLHVFLHGIERGGTPPALEHAARGQAPCAPIAHSTTPLSAPPPAHASRNRPAAGSTTALR
jgi:hypothetical protein